MRKKVTPRTLLHRVLWPKVRLIQPNFHFILLGLVVIHIGLGFASILGSHQALWYYFGGRRGLVALGVTHWFIAAMMITGVYWQFRWTRTGLLFSITLYLLQFCLFTAGEYRGLTTHGVTVSVEESIWVLGLMLLSLASYRQPAVRVPLEELTLEELR
jgi:hypothetical protein